MENQKLFAEIIKQVGSGHADEFESLVKEINQRDEKSLCTDYQAVLDAIGDNPLEEKELSDIIEKANSGEISSFEIASNLLGKEFVKATDMEQITLLIRKAIKKVLEYKDDKGILKRTPLLETYEPMTPIDRMKFENLKIENTKLKDEKAKNKKEKEIDAFVAKATNVNIDELSVWEKGLFLEILNEEAKGITNIFLGKK